MGKNLAWFGEIERKLAKLSMTTFTYRSSSYLFYVFNYVSTYVNLKFNLLIKQLILTFVMLEDVPLIN
jgi:hypothetical protein